MAYQTQEQNFKVNAPASAGKTLQFSYDYEKSEDCGSCYQSELTQNNPTAPDGRLFNAANTTAQGAVVGGYVTLDSYCTVFDGYQSCNNSKKRYS